MSWGEADRRTPRLFTRVHRASASLAGAEQRKGNAHLPLQTLFTEGPPFPGSSWARPAHPGLTSVTAASPSALAEVAWQPTCLTSPFCVLSAAGVLEDYYTSGLSWGRERLALALSADILLFHPTLPKTPPARALLRGDGNNSNSTSGSGSDAGGSRGTLPTSVAVSRASDSSCFVGFADGSLALYAASESGLLSPTTTFCLPESPLVAHTRQLSALAAAAPSEDAAAAAVRGVSSLLSKATATFTSVGALATSERYPWSAAVGTSSCGLLIADARSQRPCTLFGGPSGAAGGSTSLAVTDATSLTGLPHQIVQTLRGTERICGATWNASGSLIAVGTGSGYVHIWSVRRTSEPLQSLCLQRDNTVKAICFHSTKPYELLVGGENRACVYDVSGAAPQLSWVARTSAPVTQAVYSPDGEHVVTAHGAVPSGPASSRPPPRREGEDEDLGLVYNAVDARSEGSDDAEENGRGADDGNGDGGSHRRCGNGSLSSFCLAVWKKTSSHGGQAREELRRCFYRDEDRREGGGSAEGRTKRLQFLYILPGHRSRPLHLATPFAPTASSAASGHHGDGEVFGCVASEASGEDCTIRFWRVFQSEAARLGGVRVGGERGPEEGEGCPPRQRRPGNGNGFHYSDTLR